MLNTTNNNTAPLSDAEVLQASAASAASAANTASEATLELHEAQERLAQELAVFRGCTVALAYSGGTDISLLLKLLTQQKQQYGGAIYPLMVSTVMHPQGELAEAQELCHQLGVELHTMFLDELPIIKHNPENRCYLCKHALMSQLKAQAQALGCLVLLDGTNADDLKQYRPGIKALQELQIISPLARANITKVQVRSMLQALGLKTAHKPSSPCLATRFPYGTTLEKEQLQAIGAAEDALHQIGFYNVRVRAHPHEQILRLELDRDLLGQAISQRKQILEILHQVAGYKYFSLDLEGFHSGSMDKTLDAHKIAIQKAQQSLNISPATVIAHQIR